MKFSVIVIAFDRKIFIKGAILSILRTGLDTSNIEIIVVKNFMDREIDEFISQNNAIGIFTERQGLSDKVLMGVELSSGDYICFLEDDDEFTKDKIVRLRNLIANHPGIDYIHNGHSIMRDGNMTRGHLYPGVNRITHVVNRNEKLFNAFINTGSFFNLSSLTISKRFGIYLLKTLKNGFTNIVDLAIFVEAFESERLTLLFVPDELTTYRVSNNSHFFLMNYKSFCEAEWNLAKKEIYEIEKYLESENLIFSVDGLKCLLNGWKIRHLLYSPKISEREDSLTFINAAINCFLNHYSLIGGLNVLLSFITFLNKSLGGRMFYIYRSIQIKML